MKRPFIVCHILSAIGGKISGEFMSSPDAAGARASYGNLREFYQCDSILYGTNTMAESYGLVEKLPKAEKEYARDDLFLPCNGEAVGEIWN